MARRSAVAWSRAGYGIETARILYGLRVDVPYNGWPGYSESAETITGTIFDYKHVAQGWRFVLKFPCATDASLETDHIALPWSALGQRSDPPESCT